ncbi:MAG: hypothetical protein RL186_1222, partial [Pseudomonadota bacterium]
MKRFGIYARHHHPRLTRDAKKAHKSGMSNFVAAGFEPVLEAFEANFAEGLELGAGFCAMRDGVVLVDLHAGYADRAKTKPWNADTLVPVYSTTKPIAAIIIARLQDQGLLDLDEPITRLWPEFSAHGKDVTIAQAMSHQAGVPGFKDPIDPALWLDPPALAKALAALEPLWPPTTANGYHPLTYGYIVGELAARAAGETLGTHLRNHICAPLGIDFWIGLPDSQHERVGEMSRPKGLPTLGEITPERRVAFLTPWAAPNRGGAKWRRAEIPSANGHGTARAVATLYGVFANGGRIGDQTIISAPTLGALTKARIKGQDLVLPFELEWAAGIMRNSNLTFGPNPHALCHSGWG